MAHAAGNDNPIAITTGELAAMLDAELVGPGDLVLGDLSGIEPGKSGALSFIRNVKYAGKWAASACPAALVTRGIEVPGHDPSLRALLVVDDADIALVQILGQIAPKPHVPPAGAHPSAVVDPGARVDPSAAIGAHVVVGAGSVIGPGAVVCANCTIGAGVRIGPGTILRPGCVVEDRCEIGGDGLLHPNVVIGADGFGFVPNPDGSGMVKVPHAGNVTIGDRVEIGAGSCVDRGKLAPTTIGDDTKLDNMVQVGHNAQIGRGVFLAAHISLGGSVVLGDGVMMGGHSAVVDHKVIGAGSRIGGAAAVNRDVPPNEDWAGNPICPGTEYAARVSAWRKLARDRRDKRGKDDQ